MRKHISHSKAGPRRGAMLVLVAITLVILLITVAFSVDVAFMQLTRTQLRTSTDAASRAAMESLSRTQSIASATQAARDAAAANSVAGVPLLLADEDIFFGNSEAQADGSFDFRVGQRPLNAARVIGRRTNGSPSGPVGLMFAGILGPNTFVPVQEARTVAIDRDICVVVDRSGSMNERVSSNSTPDGFPWCEGPHPTESRWAHLTRAFNIFLGLLNQSEVDELVGLVSYSSDTETCGQRITASTIESRMVTDYMPLLIAMRRYSESRVVGATNIAAGIDNGVRVLMDPSRSRRFAEKTLIVLTDGIENQPDGVEGLGTSAPAFPRGAVRATMEAKAREPDLIVHTITFSNSANQVTMREVARVGGGNHYHAPTADRLEEIFREIALTLSVVTTE